MMNTLSTANLARRNDHPVGEVPKELLARRARSIAREEAYILRAAAKAARDAAKAKKAANAATKARNWPRR